MLQQIALSYHSIRHCRIAVANPKVIVWPPVQCQVTAPVQIRCDVILCNGGISGAQEVVHLVCHAWSRTKLSAVATAKKHACVLVSVQLPDIRTEDLLDAA